MANRLSAETSPYLQQHAQNPVDWYPWGPEALERARREDKPILLSIGYSACHWCHVMAHESFEDEGVAAVMNRHFVNVKVDREERPDLDQIYQSAHQLLAQRGGGWPLTMFLGPDGTPFFGGTYFPKTARYGLPGFADLLERVAEVWREKRADIAEQGAQVRQALAHLMPTAGGHASDFSDQPVRDALDRLRASFDSRHGGFGGAPKFPHPTDLELCLRVGATRGDAAAREMAETTLTRMVEGGIFDQLRGGFCRYSTDARWLIPHFEKMLYDNGALVAVLAQAWQATRRTHFHRAATDTVDWLTGEMQSPDGGFYSSLDADSAGEEGRYYVWDRDEVRHLLTAEEAAVAVPFWGMDGEPNFEGRHWHLHVARSYEEAARLGGIPESEAFGLVSRARTKLLAARGTRVRPGRDDKILVSWNALAIRALAMFARANNGNVRPARLAVRFIREHMWKDGRLFATYKDGRAHLNAYLDDYAFLIDALLELLQADFDMPELELACDLADVLLDEFLDRDAGGFFFTGRSHEKLIHRPKPGHDNATPSGNGVAAFALNRLAALTGDDRYAAAAQGTAALFYPAMRAQPGGFAQLMVALEEQLEPPAVLVLRGTHDRLQPWKSRLGREFLPGVIVLAIPDNVEGLPPVLDKPAGGENVNAWLCRGVNCLPAMKDMAAVIAACKNPGIG